jgi:hypothetical protein
MNWFAIVGAIVGTVGGIVGAIGGLLSLRDRYMKGRPIASFTMTTHNGRPLLGIRVTNTTQYDVVVTGAKEQRGVYFLSENFDTGNLIRGQIREGMLPPFMLKPTESRELFLMPKFQGGVAVEVLAAQEIEVVIEWRRGNATAKRQRSIAVSADTQMLRRIAGVE